MINDRTTLDDYLNCKVFDRRFNISLNISNIITTNYNSQKSNGSIVQD